MSRYVLDPSTSRITEAEFVQFFGVPREHSLTCTKYEATGMDTMEWQHEERDAGGAFVARYVTTLTFDGYCANNSCLKYGADDAPVGEIDIPIMAMLEADSKRR